MSNTSSWVNQDNQLDQVAHFTNLKKSYRAVGARTWLSDDFEESNLEISRNLFTPESLQARKPRPKQLEVFALLSGLPFAQDFSDKLVAVQTQISEILGERLHYWVAPQNLGVEYCVFKWPTDSWQDENRNTIHNVLKLTRQRSFTLHICGVQINPDGCVVAKGFDEDALITLVRDELRSKILFLPKKQSSWAHVPLGRILEPIGSRKYENLKKHMHALDDMPIASTEITSFAFIHEKRWYMEEREVLAEYPLLSLSSVQHLT